MPRFDRVQGVIGACIVILGVFYWAVPAEKNISDVVLISLLCSLGGGFFLHDLYRSQMSIDIDEWGIRKKLLFWRIHTCPWEKVVEVELKEKGSEAQSRLKYIKITYQKDNQCMGSFKINSNHLKSDEIGIIIYEIEKYAPKGLRRTFELFSLEIS